MRPEANEGMNETFNERYRHILGPILVIFEICQFLTIPGPFEYFSENGWSQKIKVFSMKERSLPLLLV